MNSSRQMRRVLAGDQVLVRRDVLLRLWQPCAVLLGACVVAALPTLVAVLR